MRRAMSWSGAAAVLIAIVMLAAPVAHAAVTVLRVDARINGTAGETLATGDVVAIKASDGKIYKADADESTLRPAIGVIGKGGASGSKVEIVTRGALGGLTSLTPGAYVYISSTAGGRTQSAVGGYPQQIGVALSSTVMSVNVGVPSAAVGTAAISSTELASDAVTTAKIADAAVTSTKASTPLITKSVLIAVENLSAGVDIGDGTAANARTVWRAPSDLTLTAAKIVGFAAAAGIDASNTAVIKLYKNTGATAVVSKTYNNSTTWPAAGVFDDLGTLNSGAKVFSSGDVLRFDIVNGATADPPAFLLQVDYITAD